VTCFLFLPPFEDSFPSAEVDIRRRDVPDPFVVAPMVVETSGLSCPFYQTSGKASKQINTDSRYIFRYIGRAWASAGYLDY
jgi:hypothetical protein